MGGAVSRIADLLGPEKRVIQRDDACIACFEDGMDTDTFKPQWAEI